MTRHIQFPHLNNIGLGQFGQMLTLAFSCAFGMFTLSVAISDSGSSFSNHVFAIALWRRGKEMIWSATRWIVAMMTYVQRPRVFPVTQNKGNATSNVHFTLNLNLSIWQVFPSLSVARPFPTSISVGREINVRPETVNIFLSKLDCDRFRNSHELNLLKRWFKLWLGSFGASTSFEPLCILT